jgi:hypothetical protein
MTPSSSSAIGVISPTLSNWVLLQPAQLREDKRACFLGLLSRVRLFTGQPSLQHTPRPNRRLVCQDEAPHLVGDFDQLRQDMLGRRVAD